MGKMGKSVHLDFYWNRDLLLHFLRGLSRPLSNHGRIVVCDVWVSLDGQIMKRNCPPGRQDQRNRKHDYAVVQGKIDKKNES